MTSPATNPISYNAYIQAMASMAVVQASETSGVWAFNDANLETITPQMLNYAELRIQRDLDILQSQSANTYMLTAGSSSVTLPVNDFLVVQTVEVLGLPPPNSTTLLPVSREFIQNVYGTLATPGIPQYFAMTGDTFGNGGDVNNTILFGPPASYGFQIRVSGVIRMPSLYQNATAGIADTGYTYISQWYPDMLVMASMIFISAYQRNFSATSDSPDMGMTYEKQYQVLRLGAIPEENRKKSMGSGWSPYSTPTAATPTR
jgi:hypothetical protein